MAPVAAALCEAMRLCPIPPNASAQSLQSICSCHRQLSSLHIGSFADSTKIGRTRDSRAVTVQRAAINPGSSATSSGELYLPFRPPPSFTQSLGSTEEQLERLRDRIGLWHELAPIIESLQRAGFNPKTIDEATGMTGFEQNKIIVGAQVYNSLKQAGMDPADLAYFDAGSGEVLYELRILSVAQRREIAKYAIEQRLDGKGAENLARAVKDQERRKSVQGRECFTTAPGDALAFSFYRAALEAKSEADKINYVNSGLEVAVSEKASQKLQELLQKDKTKEQSANQARLQTLRLLKDETTARAVPVVGNLEDVCKEVLDAAPACPSLTEGEFPVFSAPGASKWVAVPGWEIVARAGAPVALLCQDVSYLPGQQGTTGATLLVVDRESQEVTDENFYLITTEGGKKLSLQAGAVVKESGAQVCGQVVVALRPPITNTAEAEDLDLD